MKPKLSVRLMCYMHAAFLKDAMDGIMNQITNFNFEVVIGDDFSTDNSIEIIKSYQNTDRISIKLLDRKLGDTYSIARQKYGRLYNFVDIINNCNGEYIALLDGDDYWVDPYKLQKQVDFLEKNSLYAGCFHYTQQVNMEGEKDKIYGNYGRKLDFSAIDTFSTTTLFHTSSFIFRRETLFIPEWFTKVVGGDMALFSIVSAKGKLRCLPEIMSVYRKHEGGITNSSIATFENHHKKRIELMNYLNEYHDFKYTNKANQVITYHENCLNGKDESVNFVSKVKNRIKRIFDL